LTANLLKPPSYQIVSEVRRVQYLPCMLLTSLSLHHFRCHIDLDDIAIGEQVTLISGENARGKTSILEAIYLLSHGRGFREDEELELLTFGASSGYVNGRYIDTQSHEASVTYQRQEEKLAKKYLLNKAATTVSKFRTIQTPAVLFAPHQLDIVTHSPSYRREYLDTTIGRIDPIYAKSVREYGVAIRKRNMILETITSDLELEEQLQFWDSYLIERATIITSARQAYITMLHEHPVCARRAFRVVYHANHFSREHLESTRSAERHARRTLIGPQKDDFEILICEDEKKFANQSQYRNVQRYGSRSQQRLALLWLKLAEIDHLKNRLHVSPLLLLDDIFSEFDPAHQQIIYSLLPHYQTVITSTEDHLPALQSGSEVVEIRV